MGNVRVVLATEPENHFQALYLDGRLMGDFGDNLSANRDISYEPPVDILDNLFSQPEFDGFDFIHEYRFMKGFKTWTDYGWEYDAEWPEDYNETGEVPVEWYTYAEPEENAVRTD